MRRKFNLDITNLDTLTCLWHGNYGHGKTYSIGDALRTEREHGPVGYLNISGEDGYLSIAGMGLGSVAETVENLTDFESYLAEHRKQPLRALGVDSLKALVRMVMEGANHGKMPEKTDYIYIHWTMERLVLQLRQAAAYVICACPSDKSVDQLSGRTYITPDLPGREAVASAGWFNFVGFISADVLGPGRVMRKLFLAPSLSVATRQQLPSPILHDIVLPEGGGGWTNFKTAVKESLAKIPQPKETTKT